VLSAAFVLHERRRASGCCRRLVLTAGAVVLALSLA
jgi:hypothetical protein